MNKKVCFKCSRNSKYKSGCELAEIKNELNSK